MRRTVQQLTAFGVARAKEPGYLGDGGGLYLQVSGSGSKSWIFRFALAKRRREMGLGPYPEVSLAQAREAAASARSWLKAGKDPIEARVAERERQRLEAARSVTFDQAAEQFISGHEGGWKNEKHRQQWRNTLKTYGSPKIGWLSVGDVGTSEVIGILERIWGTKPETASRLRGRIERILDWAKVRGYRQGENPARWRGHLDKVFAAKGKVRKVKHHEAVPIDAMPAIYQRLRGAAGISAKAQRFTILTVVRGGVTTGAKWPEFDRDEGVWTIPAERMKASREHRVPLSKEAIEILDEMVTVRTDDRVFPGHKKDKPLSLTALSKALRAAGGGNATTHGARSTFKDWASERTSFPNEVSEMALAHVVSDKVEAAYRRGDLMKKRAAMMEAWAGFVATPRKSANVVRITEAVGARAHARRTPGRVVA